MATILEDSLDGFSDMVKNTGTLWQLASTTLLPIPLYLVGALLMSVLSGEYQQVASVSILQQVWHSVHSLALLSPVAALWHFLVLNGYVGHLYWRVGDYGLPYLLFSMVLYMATTETIFYWVRRVPGLASGKVSITFRL